MLGSEYNWLVTFTRVADGTIKVSLARTGLFTLAIALFCFLSVALHAAPGHVISREAFSAPNAAILRCPSPSACDTHFPSDAPHSSALRDHVHGPAHSSD